MHMSKKQRGNREDVGDEKMQPLHTLTPMKALPKKKRLRVSRGECRERVEASHITNDLGSPNAPDAKLFPKKSLREMRKESRREKPQDKRLEVSPQKIPEMRREC